MGMQVLWVGGCPLLLSPPPLATQHPSSMGSAPRFDTWQMEVPFTAIGLGDGHWGRRPVTPWARSPLNSSSRADEWAPTKDPPPPSLPLSRPPPQLLKTR